MLGSLTSECAVSKDKDSPDTFSHFNLLDGKVESSPNHVMVRHTDGADCIHLALKALYQISVDVGLPTGTPLPGIPTSPFVFTQIKSTRTNRGAVHPLLDKQGNFRPVSSAHLNKRLKLIIHAAGLSSKYGAFCLTDFRSSALMQQLDTETNIRKINSEVGWRGNSNMAMLYGRQRQYNSHLRHAVASASLVEAHENRTFKPLSHGC